MKNSLLYKGLNNSLPEHVAKKVFATNMILMFLMFCLAIPFTILSLIHFDVFIASFPFMGIVFCTMAYLINCFYTKGIYIARYFVCFMPITLGALYNAYLSNTGEQMLPALGMAEVSFISIPFVVYDLKREWKKILPVTIVLVLIIVTFPIQNELLVYNIDSQIIRTGYLSMLTTVFACISSIGCILGLSMLNNQEIEKSELLSQERNLSNEALRAREEEHLEELEMFRKNAAIENWEKTGQIKIWSTLRESNEVFQKYINELCRYVQCHIAVMYSTQGNSFNLLSSYACKNPSEYIDIEDGSVMTDSFKTKEVIYNDNLPEDYFKGHNTVSSGLGKCIVGSLLIIPLISIDGNVEGIIQMGFLRKLNEREIKFLTTIHDNLINRIINESHFQKSIK